MMKEAKIRTIVKEVGSPTNMKITDVKKDLDLPLMTEEMEISVIMVIIQILGNQHGLGLRLKLE